MKKSIKINHIVMAAILFSSFSFYPQLIHADPSHTYFSIKTNAGPESAASLFGNRTINDTDAQNQKVQNTNVCYRFMESLSYKLMDKKETIDWSDNLFFNTDNPSEFGENPYESHDWKFDQINDTRRDTAQKLIFNSAADVFKTTRLGKKIQKIEHSASKYLTFKYSKPFDDQTPFFSNPHGQGASKKPDTEPDTLENGYGFSFSTKLHFDTETFVDNIVFELNSNYSSTHINTTYELQNNTLALEFSNTSLNTCLGMTLGFCINKNSSETSGAFKAGFDF